MPLRSSRNVSMNEFVCPNCKCTLKLPPSAAGRRARCLNCKTLIDIPNAALAAEEIPADSLHALSEASLLTLPTPLPPKDPWAQFLKVARFFWRSYWRVACIGLAVVAIAGLGGYYALRDTWERDNAVILKEARNHADELRDSGHLLDAASAYRKVVAIVGDHKLSRPELRDILEQASHGSRDALDLKIRRTQDSANSIPTGPWDVQARSCGDVIADIMATRALVDSGQAALLDRVRQSVVRTDFQALLAGQKSADVASDSNPALAIRSYDKILAEAGRLAPASTELQLLIDQVTRNRDRLSKQQNAGTEYLNSIDPFLQQLIPFVRRLRWGMPERMFMDRATKLIAAWRAIKDPPDRTTIGELLSRTNELAGDMASMETIIKERQEALSRKSLNDLFKNLRPPEVKEDEWGGLVNKYVLALQQLLYIGKTIKETPDIERVRMFELTYRGIYLAKMGSAYKGEATIIIDKLNAAKRAAFLDSLQDFLDQTLPTLRHLERGMERQLLLKRLAEIDAQFGKTTDPPDDSALGEHVVTLNQISESVYLYAITKVGANTLDMIGQDDKAAKEITDAGDELLRRLRAARRDLTPEAEAQAYAAAKKEWLETHKIATTQP